MKVYKSIREMILIRIINNMNVIVLKRKQIARTNSSSSNANHLKRSRQQQEQQMRKQLLYKKIVLKHSSAIEDLATNLINNSKLNIAGKPIAQLDHGSFVLDAEKLYLNEKYLRVVKLADQRVDSKYIVDRATKRPVNEVLSCLHKLDESNVNEIHRFIEMYLHEPGVEITKANFSDWSPSPKFIDTLHNSSLKHFSRELNKIWLDLYKKFDVEKLENKGVSSHLPMLHPFIVPGGRFIEMYYWDTYWTIEGLLVCDMFDTVQKMLENFIHFIRQFGFIPNGSRVYYLNRSQPPYFAHMCMTFYEFSLKSKTLTAEKRRKMRDFVLNECLFHMIKEYQYWMKHKSVRVKCEQNANKIHKLNVFRANTIKPRPESYFEDLHTAQHLKCENAKRKLFMDIATAAESGYDFSSRWFKEPHSMHTIQTTDLIPVDLNCVLYKSEKIISELCLLKGYLKMSTLFSKYASRRQEAINAVLWSEDLKCWADLNMRTNQLTQHFYISNLAPLNVGIRPPSPKLSIKQMLNEHVHLFECYDGGVPVSMIRTEQQWDHSNVWAPNQHACIMLLFEHDRQLALKLAKKFFNTVYKGWQTSGVIFEKYDVETPGQRGSGGEYETCTGFGWTNGVILNIINIFKDEIID